jgi:hypothetical protein
MVCLHGSVCNETLGGVCTGCPSGFRDDETLFIGNRNCGLDEKGFIAVYFIASVFALSVAGWAFMVARPKKNSLMRGMLFFVSAWTSCIPALCLAHYLAGFRNGIAAIVIYSIILMLVNTQTFILMYQVERILSILLDKRDMSRLYRRCVQWFVFWMAVKVTCAVALLIGEATHNSALYNNAQMALLFSLLVEVPANCAKQTITNESLIKSAKALHGSLKMSSNPIVLEFASKVERTRWILPLYGTVILTAGICVLATFIIYESSVPYAYILQAYLLCTWPILGVRPIGLVRSKLGARLERSSKATGQENNNGTGPDSSNSPRTATKTAAIVARTPEQGDEKTTSGE